MKLSVWYRTKADRRLTAKQLAEAAGCSEGTFQALVREGPRVPRPSVIEGIARLTGGRVMPNDWFPELTHANLRKALPPKAKPKTGRQGSRRKEPQHLRMLRRLQAAPGAFVPKADLLKLLYPTRTKGSKPTCHAAASRLRKEGYQVTYERGRGYRLEGKS